MVYRGELVLNPTLYGDPTRDRPNNLIRASRFLLLPAVAELVLITTLFDVAGLNNLLIQSLFAVAVVITFNVAMLALLLPLAPIPETISPTAASRLERVAAVASLTILLLATSLFVSVALIGEILNI